MSQDQPIIHTESMHFGISYGIWIDCCILVCSLNSLCPWKSSASSGWNVNSCLEKEISHCNHNIIFIVWSFTGSLVSFLLINELSSCSIVPIYAKLDWLASLSCWFSFLPSHLFLQLNTAIYYQCWAVFCDIFDNLRFLFLRELKIKEPSVLSESKNVHFKKA